MFARLQVFQVACNVSTYNFAARQSRTLVSATTLRQERDKKHEGNHIAPIPNRSIIEIEGPDTIKFLQGLTTNQMTTIATGGDGLFTAFLTAQGRMLCEAFIYPVNVGVNFPHPKFILECSTPGKEQLIRHLKRYLLRSKVKIRDASEEYSLWSIWGDALNQSTMNGANVPAGSLVKKDKRVSDVGCFDPRVPNFGYRAVIPKAEDIRAVLSDFEELPESEYTIRRILNGIPEGPQDIWPEQSLPLESNFDYMNGVNFRKGCYIGQELTIRTYHTGVVRKRIVPVQIYHSENSIPTSLSVDRQAVFPSGLNPQLDIKLEGGKSKRSLGKMGSGIHNIGLALMRLEHVQKCVDGEPAIFRVPEAGENIFLRPFFPNWWPVEQTTPQ